MGLITCTPYFIQLGNGYFMRTMGGAIADRSYAIAMDSNNDILEVGGTTSIDLFNNDMMLTKSDPEGNILWHKLLSGNSSEVGYGVATDSSDNIYVTGYTLSDGAGGQDMFIVKYNASGSIQWQKTLGGSGSETGRGIAIDSADNVYIMGYTTSDGAGGYDIIIAKYNSSGTIQWSRVLGGASTELGYAMAIDSSDNLYVTGYTSSTGAGSDDALIAKYNSSGTIQWQRTLGGSSGDGVYGIAIDSADNICIVGFTGSTGEGSYDILIAKYNSSGTIQWQRTLGGTGFDYGSGIATDSANNIYITGYVSVGNGDMVIAKYNSSGTIQWQRTLGGTGGDVGRAIIIDSSDDIYISGETASGGTGGTDMFLAKLPSDGSLTGTYGNFTYAVSTLIAPTTNSSLTAPTTNSSLTASTSNSSLTSADSALVDSLLIIDPTIVVATALQLSGLSTVQRGAGKIVEDSLGFKYLIASSSNGDGAGGNDLMLVKISDTALIWGRTLGGVSSESGLGIAIDSSDNIFITGTTSSEGAGGSDIVTAKYNTSGTIQWQRTLGGTGSEQGNAITTDSSGNVFVAGQTTSEGEGSWDIIFIKYNSSGTLQWQKMIGGTGSDIAYGITTDSSSNIYISGQTSSSGQGSVDIFVAKFNTNGILQWQRTIGGTGVDAGRNVVLDSSNNVYVVGYTASSGAGLNDIVIVKYTSSGTIQWHRTIGSAGSEDGYGIAIDSSNNLYVHSNGYIVKYTSGGSLLFQKVMTTVWGILISGSDLTLMTSGRLLYTTDLSASEFTTSTLTAPGGNGSLLSATSNLTAPNIQSTLTPANSNLTPGNSTVVAAQEISVRIGIASEITVIS